MKTILVRRMDASVCWLNIMCEWQVVVENRKRTRKVCVHGPRRQRRLCANSLAVFRLALAARLPLRAANQDHVRQVVFLEFLPVTVLQLFEAIIALMGGPPLPEA